MVLTKNLSPDSFHELLVLSASHTTGRQLVSCTDEDQETHSFHAGFRISLKVFINNSCVKFPPSPWVIFEKVTEDFYNADYSKEVIFCHVYLKSSGVMLHLNTYVL